MQREEDDDNRKCNTAVECCRENVIVSHPPSEVEASHEVLEDSTDNEPSGIVNSGRGNEPVQTGEHDRYIDKTPTRERVSFSEEVEGNGKNRADEEEVHDGIVDLSGAKQAGGTDATP